MVPTHRTTVPRFLGQPKPPGGAPRLGLFDEIDLGHSGFEAAEMDQNQERNHLGLCTE